MSEQEVHHLTEETGSLHAQVAELAAAKQVI
jgi:hypothetical protein